MQSIDVSAVLRQAVRGYYADLVTRATGRAVREEIERAMVAEEPVVCTRMDFSGVRIIDFSCADEIVAKLVRGGGGGGGGGRVRVLVLRGVSAGHLQALEQVLEGHGLAVAVEHDDGTLDAIGPRETGARLLEELVALELAWRTPAGALALRTA